MPVIYACVFWFFQQGAIFSIGFSDDSPFLLAIGGSKGKLKVAHSLLTVHIFGFIPSFLGACVCRFGMSYRRHQLLTGLENSASSPFLVNKSRIEEMP